MNSPPPWKAGEEGNQSGLLNVGTHSMFLSVTGTPRKADQPVVVIEAGIGQHSTYWAAVTRLVSPFARVYAYDRSGQGASDASPLPRTAENMAKELELLLRAAGVEGPYVLLAHSFGGIIVREFLDLVGDAKVAGMVLVDCRTEFSDAWRPEGLENALGIAFQGLDFSKVLKLEERRRLNDEEWAALGIIASEEDSKKRLETTMAEIENYPSGCRILGAKQQFEKQALGDGVVSVVKGNNLRDMGMLLAAAIEKGLNTTEQEKARAVLEVWLASPEKEVELEEKQLKLSRRGRLVHASESGHDVHLTQPQVIAEEVRWVFSVLEGGKA